VVMSNGAFGGLPQALEDALRNLLKQGRR
jgi:hypothetical protein